MPRYDIYNFTYQGKKNRKKEKKSIDLYVLEVSDKSHSSRPKTSYTIYWLPLRLFNNIYYPSE